MEENSIWITRTSQGYCARYKTTQAEEYLTPRPGLEHLAGYVSFPTLIQRIVELNRKFYQVGVKVEFDSNAQTGITQEEQDAITYTVSKLEGFAKDVLVRDKKISAARKSLDSSCEDEA